MLTKHYCKSSWTAARVFALAAAIAVALTADVAFGQQGYGSYYGQTVKQTHGQLGTQSTSRYLYDQHFYKRSTVSPYINLDRADLSGVDSYHAYVKPEQERRQRTMAAQSAYIDARKREGRVGDTRFPGATYGGGGTAILKPVPQRKSTPSAYYNHWYGGWQNR